MATARDLIKRTMRLLQVLETGEAPTSQEANDGLETLNSMLDEWNIDRAYVLSIDQVALTWPGSTESRTIGATGDFAQTRPVQIHESTFYTDANGDDFNFRILDTRMGYTKLVDKDTASDLPEFLYYEPSFPNGTLYVWPVPSSSITVQLNYWTQLSSFASLDTTVSLAPGYTNLVVYGLCEYLAPEFGVAVPQEVLKIAHGVRGRVKKKNFPKHISMSEPTAINSGSRSYNIFTE